MLAQQPDETTQDFHVFPQIADGDGWQSFLLVTNVSQSASQCTFNLYGMDVDRFADISGITAAGSTATFDLEGLGDYLVWGTKNELSVTSGYGTLDCSAPVVAQVLYAFIDQLGETAGMATVFSSQAGAVFQFPILAQGELAFAVANDADSDAFCDFVLESPDRLNLGEATLPVPAKSKVARMLNEVIQVPAGFTGGPATVSCDQQVSVIGLQIDGTIFTTLPPAILSPTPNPSPEEHADLVVGSPSVNDNSQETEGSFTLSATVHNSGDGDATATTLRYYRSTEATITRSDRQVGTDAVGELSALGTSEESIDLTAPSTADTYYYGACVDAVSEESDTTNNCSGPVRVDVTEPPPSTPDLVVGSPSVNDNSQETEGSFTLSATVHNSGDGDATATTLRYYRSTEATITRSDTQVGTDAVGELSASGTSEESIDLTAPSTADTYYYGACVDAVTGESSATNNCSSSVQVDVTEPPPPSNRSPEPVGEIASRTLEAGGSETLDVSSYFNDADSDELAYAAASSDTSVATAAASGSAVTVTAVASGEAVVTVTASDPGGLTAEQGIAVTVAAGNRPPIATKTIPDQTIHVWGELQTLPSSKNRFVVRGIHNYFSDPDGDPLQYEASSSDERYATVRTSIIPALDHYQILVDPVAVGQATITLTATDPEGLNANYVFGINVSPPLPNRRPVVQWPIGARQVYVGVPVSLRLRDHFRDEDVYGSYFQLNYAVSSADNGIALVRVSDKRDHETGHGYARLVIEGVSAGETTATVVATDRAGLSVEHTFNVIARTRPPRVTRRISDVLVSAGVETYVWDLNSYFTDPDGHDLVYGASSSDTTVVRASISRHGPYVVLSAREVGTADIAVTATDVTGLTASQTFTVTVVSPRPPTITRRISDRSVSVGSETYVYSLQNYFADPEGRELVYDASSSDTSVVRASVGEDGPYVVLSARTVGTADVTVTATDVTGLTASQTFTVTVTR